MFGQPWAYKQERSWAVFSNCYAARHTHRVLLKLCKRCLLSKHTHTHTHTHTHIYIYIYIYIYIHTHTHLHVLQKGMLALYLSKSLSLEKPLNNAICKISLTLLKYGFHYTVVYENSNHCALVDITYTECFPNQMELVEQKEVSHLHRKINIVFQCAFFTLNNATKIYITCVPNH